MALGQMKGEHEGLLATKKLLCRMHKNIIFCLENLGVWGALQVKLFSTSLPSYFSILLYIYFLYSMFVLTFCLFFWEELIERG